MADEDELQRKELSRLLSTAKDEERKNLIRQAMNTLDGHEKTLEETQDKFNINLSPSVHASLRSGQSMPVFESFGNARLRPVSARRRPSMPNLLDSIPEVISSTRNSTNEEIFLTQEDISDVISTCFDPRFPGKELFRINTNQTSSGSPSHPFGRGMMHSSPSQRGFLPKVKPWLSTGLVPHLFTVIFYEKWLIKKIEITCANIEKISVHINYSINSTVNFMKLIEMKQINDDKFSVQIMSQEDEPNLGSIGIGVSFVIQKASHHFVSVSQIRINVAPHT